MTSVRNSLPSLSVLMLTLFLCGCGDNHNNPFSKCGNGVCDAGEACDDGAIADTPPDEDQCLSTCQFNVCGDGFVNRFGPNPNGVVCVTPLPDDVLPMEECDPGSLEQIPCSDLGYSGDTVGCTDDCKFDTSTCGAPFTPTLPSTSTPTSSPTPTVTPTNTPGGPTSTPTPTSTATPTATPTRLESCGDGIVEEPESCDNGGRCMGGENQGASCVTMGNNGQCPAGTNMGSPCTTNADCPESICPVACGEGICVTQEDDGCPASCLINPCEPADTTSDFEIVFSVPFGETATSATFFVDYPDGTVSLPGTGLNAETLSRIFTGTCDSPGQELCERNTECPEGATCDRPGGTLVANDLDYAVRIVIDRQPAIEPGPSFVIEFDDCAGAPPPSAASFTCIIQGCAGTFGQIDGCDCTVEAR